MLTLVKMGGALYPAGKWALYIAHLHVAVVESANESEQRDYECTNIHKIHISCICQCILVGAISDNKSKKKEGNPSSKEQKHATAGKVWTHRRDSTTMGASGKSIIQCVEHESIRAVDTNHTGHARSQISGRGDGGGSQIDDALAIHTGTCNAY